MLVLILIVVDNGLVPDSRRNRTDNQHQVLILIVVDNGLVPAFLPISSWFSISLNPYCSGQWSRTGTNELSDDIAFSLNPYCSGQWSRTGKGFS